MTNNRTTFITDTINSSIPKFAVFNGSWKPVKIVKRILKSHSKSRSVTPDLRSLKKPLFNIYTNPGIKEASK